MRTMQRYLPALTWAMALALFAWALSKLPLAALWQAVATLQVRQWLLWLGLNLLIIALLVGRWLILTRAMGLPLGFGQLLRLRQAGQFISFVTPGPQFGGEPLQVYWLWHRYRTPGHSALLAVGLDRFYELWINFAILLLAVMGLANTASRLALDWQGIAAVLLLLALMLPALAWLLLRHPQRLQAWVERLTRPWQSHPRLRQLHTHFSELHAALQTLTRTRRGPLAAAIVVSLLAWVGMIGEFWLLLRFAGLDLEPGNFMLLFTVLRLSFLLPLPGGMGSMEAGMLWAFQALALPLSTAAGLIALMRLRDVLVLVLSALLLPGLTSGESSAPKVS